jgi:hypothetical protein
MNRTSTISLILLAWTAVVVAGFAALAPTLVAGSAEPCCFANDRYEGTCKVTPGEGETCQSILAYLNNPMSTGKLYCGSTSVRGGWVQADCKAGNSISRQGASGSTSKARMLAPACEEGLHAETRSSLRKN